jgi:phage terminase small subunit
MTNQSPKFTPPMPSSLVGDKVAEDTWNLLTSKIEDHVSINGLEREMFGRYCQYNSVYETARQDVAASGPCLRASNGIAYKNPAFAI